MLVFYGSLHPEVQATNFCFEVELQFLPGDSQWFIVLPRPVWCSLANLKSSQPFRSAFLMLKVLHLIKVLGFCLNRCEHYLVVRLLLANKMVHVVPWLGNDIVTYPIQLVCESIYRQTKAVDRLTDAKPLKFTKWKRLRNMVRTWSISDYDVFFSCVLSFSSGTCFLLFTSLILNTYDFLDWKLSLWSWTHSTSVLCSEFLRVSFICLWLGPCALTSTVFASFSLNM